VTLGPLLASVTDSSSPSLSNYTVSLYVPMETQPGTYGLQVAYNPNNPEAPDTFYNCADVQVV
jgi:hypothetical protein